MEHNSDKYAPQEVKEMAQVLGGTIESSGLHPDGQSGFATLSMPLRKDHWLTKEGYNNPPMPFRMGTDNPLREQWSQAITAAARYAVRCATMNGKEDDFDPDALVQNMLVGMLGYHTHDGLSAMDDGMWNPVPTPPLFGAPFVIKETEGHGSVDELDKSPDCKSGVAAARGGSNPS